MNRKGWANRPRTHIHDENEPIPKTDESKEYTTMIAEVGRHNCRRPLHLNLCECVGTSQQPKRAIVFAMNYDGYNTWSYKAIHLHLAGIY